MMTRRWGSRMNRRFIAACDGHGPESGQEDSSALPSRECRLEENERNSA